MSKKIAIIGSGFAGLSAACCLAKEGHQVTVYEKNDTIGGRARQFKSNGFTFDMGPSWYWMPDVFENFFAHFGKKVSDYYDLKRLDPSYRVYFGQDELFDVPAELNDLKLEFEKLEKGSGEKLQQFIDEAKYKYDIGMGEFVFKPSLSIFEYVDLRLLRSIFRLNMLNSIRDYVKKYFSNSKIRKILEFPVLFLGATPSDTPAMYSLMNYADLKLGTWYPKDGMFSIIKAFESLAIELGVEIQTSCNVQSILSSNGKAESLKIDEQEIPYDIIVSGADYHHTEQSLLKKGDRNYSAKYWDKRVMAPSSLLFYIGVKKKVEGIKHHNLFFDEDFDLHAEEIYTNPKWPKKPLFYVCCPSKSDPSVAPEGMENLFFLVPIAAGLKDSEEERQKVYKKIMTRFEKLVNQKIEDNIVYSRSYALSDFVEDYNSYKGNAYGLANTLLQTAFLKPRMKSKRLSNLYYTGQLSVPGPGVPPSIISGQLVSSLILKDLK